ncbi:competence/damage-inducible protein A [Paraconexibacter sp. AEG42_29]
MSSRAGIIVTGTEVLTGRVIDRNGPWVVERLRELGVDVAHIAIVGDRPQDITGALRFFASEGVDLVVTSGGLGPTADDLTAAVVGEFQGREPVLDQALQGRIREILRPMAERWPNLDQAALEEGTRKQAVVPLGATILEPVGTAPGLVVTPVDGRSGPAVVVLPGPPRELQPMWEAATQTDAFAAATAGRTSYQQEMLRLFGIPESEIAETLRQATAAGVDLDTLEVTTCLRRGEVEIVTRYEPDAAATYAALVALIRERHADTLFSDDGSSVDVQIAALLRERGWRVGTAESCTGGLIAARLTELAGSSAYVAGGLVVYANDAKSGVAGVPEALIAEHGAVSIPVAEALATGAISTLGVDLAIGVTGIAGPDGGTEEKPVGTVCFAVATADGVVSTHQRTLPGRRNDVRDLSTTVALHLLRRALVEQPADSAGAASQG